MRERTEETNIWAGGASGRGRGGIRGLGGAVRWREH